MIDRVSGTVQAIGKSSISVDVGVIGLLLQVPNAALFKLNDAVDLYVHMHWNQDQGPTLFGFSNDLEKAVFLLIIGCSGIGPKIGLSALKNLGAERFLQAIQMEDEKALKGVSGLGPKKIEQIFVQLRRKVASLIKSGIEIKGTSNFTDWQNVSDVLTSLNYSQSEVTRAMKFLGNNFTDEASSFDDLIRHALSFLAKKR